MLGRQRVLAHKRVQERLAAAPHHPVDQLDEVEAHVRSGVDYRRRRPAFERSVHTFQVLVRNPPACALIFDDQRVCACLFCRLLLEKHFQTGVNILNVMYTG